MYYYIFKATSKDGKIVKEYLYNEAVTDKPSLDIMMTVVKEFIKKDFRSEGLNIRDFTFTRNLYNYKDFKDRFDKLKFINNRKISESNPFPKETNQSDGNKETSKKTRKSYKIGPRLPTSRYGAWAHPRKDPNSKY